MKPKIINLKEYGAVLTGREFGAEVWRQISEKLDTVAELNFEGVEAIGSSFGDEVLPPLAKRQGNQVKLYNVNSDIQNTIKAVARDAQINVDFA